MKKLAIWSPRPDAQKHFQLSEAICIYGLPAIQIAPLKLTGSQRLAVVEADTYLFTSYNAVDQLFLQIPFSQLKDRQLIAIGIRTAKALESYGLSVTLIADPPFTSESLLAMPAFSHLSMQNVVLCCGRGGRPLLQQALSRKAEKFKRIECYRRNKAKLSTKVMIEFIKTHRIAGVIISSCEIADAVVANLAQTSSDYWHWPVFVFSQRIADYAKSLGFKEIIVAPQSDQQSVNQAILAWWEIR